MFWTFIYLSLFSSVIYASEQNDFKVLGELVWGVRLEDTYLQFFPRSLLECARECLRRKRCRSINYSQALLMCELNYNAIDDVKNKKQNNVFVSSDIDTWPKKLAGRCEVNPCKENEVCDAGHCSLSDCGQIDFPIPEKSVLLMSGHHEIGNGVAFRCKEGYVMKNQVDSTDDMSTVLCQPSGQWQDVNFTCKEGCKVDELEKLLHNNAEIVEGVQQQHSYKIQCKNGYKGFGSGGEPLGFVEGFCGPDVQWNVDDIYCCKLDELEIDNNAEIVESVLRTKSFEIRCKTGYRGFGFHGEPLSSVRAFCDSDSRWHLDNIYCINPESILQDFCPSEYSYEKQHNMCYKYHDEDENNEKAKETCQNEHAHLISLTNDGVKHLNKLEAGKSYFIDGTYDREERRWRGWDGQQISIKDDPVASGHYCLMIKNERIDSSPCDEERYFICQFEMCPESAGYTLDTNDGVCYKFQSASEFNYTNEMCKLTYDDPFEVDFVKNNTDVRHRLYEKLLETRDKSLQSRAYVLLHNASKFAHEIQRFCAEKNLHPAKVDTDDIRRSIISVIGKRESAVVVGLYLNWRETYVYVFKDGKLCSDYVGWQGYTDTNKCYYVRRNQHHTVYKTVNCSVEMPSLCAELTSDGTANSFEISDNSTNYERAGKWCKEKGMSLVKISSNQIKDDVNEFLKNHTSMDLYIDMKLHNKSYTYYWIHGGGSPGVEWAENYSNDTRDFDRRVAFNVTTQKFHLIHRKTHLPFLCSTQSNTVWSGESIGTDKAFVFDKAFRKMPVSVKNRLPYICEVDMKSMIEKLHLYKKKTPLK